MAETLVGIRAEPMLGAQRRVTMPQAPGRPATRAHCLSPALAKRRRHFRKRHFRGRRRDGGGSVNGGSANGGSAGAPATSAGSAGQAGSVFNGPCGDLNHDLIDDCSETLVQNSRFDTSASNWDAEPGLTVTWNVGDASGKASSGSLRLNHTGGAGTMIGARQCIPATEDTNYDVAARVMLSAGQGQGGVNVYLFDDDACQGNIVTGNTPIEGGESGKWTDLFGTLWVRGGVHSMYVALWSQTSP